jgi:uncharacterized membrane protein
MNLLALGLVLFLVVHASSMLRGMRKTLIEHLGSKNAYKALYSIFTLAGLLLVVIGFAQYRAAGMTLVWAPPTWGRHIAMLVMLVSFISLAATYVPSNIRSTLKHPLIIAVILWSLAHLLVNGDLGSMALFGSFLVWGIVARISMGRRTRTIFVASHLSQPLGMHNDVVVVIVGVLLYAATLVWLHRLLIGVPIMAV